MMVYTSHVKVRPSDQIFFDMPALHHDPCFYHIISLVRPEYSQYFKSVPQLSHLYSYIPQSL